MISSRRQISDYSSAAGDVRLQIATTRTLGRPDPVTAVERQGIRTIRTLVVLGSRFGHDPTGNLDFSGSTPEQVDLVTELEALLPGEIETIKNPDGRVDLRKWSELAQSVLDRFEGEQRWGSLPSEEKEFVEAEFEPFLVKLLNTFPEDEEE